MKQSDVFLAGEGEAWMKRNEGRYDENNDPVLAAIDQFALHPKRVLEIGCADGARLAVLERMWGCDVVGVDPAWNTKAGASLCMVWNGTALDPPVCNDSFDAIIYGWCLYLCDPEDYFKIAEAGDRILRDGGYLIVYDFCTDHPYKVPYKHKEGIFSHHYDFSKLWLGHPAYSMYGRTVQDETCVTILKKDPSKAFPVEK